VICIGASFLRLGALADFLSRPILVGYRAGIALTIALGQIGKLTGLTIEAGGIMPKLVEVVRKLPLVHWPTLAVGSGRSSCWSSSGVSGGARRARGSERPGTPLMPSAALSRPSIV
jgi:hypothetical protein